MKRQVSVVVASLTLALATSGVAGATGIQCGDTLLESVTLSHDLIGCEDDGLIAGRAGITIDLGGHTISGADGDAGIRIPAYRGVDGVSILNGTVTGFADGVRADITSGHHIARLDVTGNDRGINLANVDDSVIEKNHAFGNVYDGIRVDGDSDGNTVQKNALVDNVLFGLTVSNGSTGNLVTANHVSGSLWGVSIFSGASNNTVSRNVVIGNAILGIQLESGSDDVVVARNHLSGNGLGILVKAEVVGHRVERNEVVANAGDGIRISGDDGSISRNEVAGNGGHGITLTAASSGNAVQFNELTGNGLGDEVDDDGDNTVG